jgi:hypothetical protein
MLDARKIHVDVNRWFADVGGEGCKLKMGAMVLLPLPQFLVVIRVHLWYFYRTQRHEG